MPCQNWAPSAVAVLLSSLAYCGSDPASIGCNDVLERLEGQRCYDLEFKDVTDESACRQACCEDLTCEVWQLHVEDGCFVGVPSVCVKSPHHKGFSGERVRHKRYKHDPFSKDFFKVELNFHWRGDADIFNQYAYIEPWPSEARMAGYDGEKYLFRRSGPGPHGFNFYVSCWARDRLPNTCCDLDSVFTPQEADKMDTSCWGGVRSRREHCCTSGMARSPTDPRVIHLAEAYLSISDRLTVDERTWILRQLPIIDVDEDSYDAKRLRWRVGAGSDDPDRSQELSFCAASSGVGDTDVAVDLIGLIGVLEKQGANLSRTFVDIGAGTCTPPDPIYPLLQALPTPRYFGVAVEIDSAALQQCEVNLAALNASVIPANLAMDAPTAGAKLAPYLAQLFPRAAPPWPLDILVMDIDASDCSVVAEIMRYATPKILVLEITFIVPPPFRFQLQHDSLHDSSRLSAYDVTLLNPLSGCSLSYAIHQFRPFGMNLLRLTYQDAVFVHDSMVPSLQQGLGLKLPMDEFECYRKSRLWLQLPVENVREWFFAPHPAQSLGHIWRNLTALNSNGRHNSVTPPFTLDY